ncbi:MAG TPA: polysaccharide deacetylase family protein [Vicinamibacterales bacterium]|jgi:peptidoglycan/xylan/chitin deacetylase (PgdA/CDA1 family)|nr:polysaccharide deacetylase family protein [Vicinamibacterales bacterium]
MSVPFGERGGALRGLMDAVCGRLPVFTIGGAVPSRMLPVFHFHDETAADLEPKFRYLAENGYQTVTADQIAAHARGESALTNRHVALCFDDAWASLWTIATPLLETYELTAITYAIPARTEEAAGCRPHASAHEGPPLVTWPELHALHASGIVDVQCHTESHSMVFCSSHVTGFVTPEYRAVPMLNRPQLSPEPALRFLQPEELGAPLYTARSRMSDGKRVDVAAGVRHECVDLVARDGGADFFERLDWQDRLGEVVARSNGHAVAHIESESDQERAIEDELDRGRAVLNDRLRTTSVRHICLPWGVSSALTHAALKRTGYESAFANRMEGAFAVMPGDDPYWLKRLPNKYIQHLPGRGRHTWI